MNMDEVKRQVPVVDVAYSCQEGEWRVTVLQFDIVGTGATRGEALAELRELVGLYLRFVMETRGPARLLNNSPVEEWASPDKESYEVEWFL